MLKRIVLPAILLTIAVSSLHAAGKGVKFPGFSSTDRAAVEAAAKNGANKFIRFCGMLRLAQIDTPEKVNTYQKQCKYIDGILKQLNAKPEENLKYMVPLSTPEGRQIWTPEGWHAARRDNSHHEMKYLVNTVESMKVARGELGDAGLFETYAVLLKKHFRHYNPAVVYTALQFMNNLVPAVNRVRAVTELTQIRSRIRAVHEKFPKRWEESLKQVDSMLEPLLKQQ